MCCSPNNKLLILVGFNKVSFFDINTKTVIKDLAVHKHSPRGLSVAMTSNKKFLVTSGTTDTIIWDVNNWH